MKPNRTCSWLPLALALVTSPLAYAENTGALHMPGKTVIDKIEEVMSDFQKSNRDQDLKLALMDLGYVRVYANEGGGFGDRQSIKEEGPAFYLRWVSGSLSEWGTYCTTRDPAEASRLVTTYLSIPGEPDEGTEIGTNPDQALKQLGPFFGKMNCFLLSVQTQTSSQIAYQDLNLSTGFKSSSTSRRWREIVITPSTGPLETSIAGADSIASRHSERRFTSDARVKITPVQKINEIEELLSATVYLKRDPRFWAAFADLKINLSPSFEKLKGNRFSRVSQLSFKLLQILEHLVALEKLKDDARLSPEKVRKEAEVLASKYFGDNQMTPQRREELVRTFLLDDTARDHISSLIRDQVIDQYCGRPNSKKAKPCSLTPGEQSQLADALDEVVVGAVASRR